MKGRRIQWRFGGQMLGWGAALAALFLGLGLWLGFSVWNKPQQPPGNPAAVASLGLTPREVEVLGLLAAGQANKEIARALGVSPNTVKTHLARLYEKLGVTSRTAAIAQARALGIVG